MKKHWKRYIEHYGFMFRKGDKVVAIKDFWFYDSFYKKDDTIIIEEDMVGHAFEDFCLLVNIR